MLLQLTFITLLYHIGVVGPEPLEALANGCVFIQPKFLIPHNKHNTVSNSSKYL